MIQKRHSLSTLLVGSIIAGLCITAQAQGLYRSVAPDGTVTYPDIPPDQAKDVQPVDAMTRRPRDVQRPTQVDVSALPSAIKNIYTSYPLTLYTTNNCAICDSAKEFMQERGLPFAEITVNTQQDAKEFQEKVSTANTFPTLRVGTKVLSSFNSTEWGAYLKAAGYPDNIQLPASYQNPTLQPMTDPAALSEAGDTANTPSRGQQGSPNRPRTTGPTPDNPTGIRF